MRSVPRQLGIARRGGGGDVHRRRASGNHRPDQSVDDGVTREPEFLVAFLVEHRFPDPEDRYAPTAERASLATTLAA
jgi:hypothetical protein